MGLNAQNARYLLLAALPPLFTLPTPFVHTCVCVCVCVCVWQVGQSANGGWWRFCDPATQYEYFWNEHTNESAYERPTMFETVKSDIFSTARTTAAKEQRFKEHLNDGWERMVDPETQMQYFVKDSGESQWERPMSFETVRGGMTAAMMSARRKTQEVPVENLGWGGWYKWIDQEYGVPYYYNESTQESSYDRPTGFETRNDPFAAEREETGASAEAMSSRREPSQLPVEVANGGWFKYIDKESGTPYYWHETTGSQFERPAEFLQVSTPAVRSAKRAV